MCKCNLTQQIELELFHMSIWGDLDMWNMLEACTVIRGGELFCLSHSSNPLRCVVQVITVFFSFPYVFWASRDFEETVSSSGSAALAKHLHYCVPSLSRLCESTVPRQQRCFEMCSPLLSPIHLPNPIPAFLSRKKRIRVLATTIIHWAAEQAWRPATHSWCRRVGVRHLGAADVPGH